MMQPNLDIDIYNVAKNNLAVQTKTALGECPLCDRPHPPGLKFSIPYTTIVITLISVDNKFR